MYIDFHKYNYDIVPENQVDKYKNRDKERYKSLVRNWLDKNLDNIAERKWEIEEIHYLKNVSDFIKLVREAEQLFEFGFYTGCISLVGVASEDFCKYLSVQLGKPEYAKLKQYPRLNNLKSDGFISNSTHGLLDDIRNIRNDCLHYDQDFKQKDEAQLKADALKALNDLKRTLKSLIGEDESSRKSDLTSVISSIGSEHDVKDVDEITIKVKNAVSHLLKFPIAFDPSSKFEIKTSVFEITEIDENEEEITLRDLSSEFTVFVEYPKQEREYYQNKGLESGHNVKATLISFINQDGLTGEWKILDIDKID